MKTTLLFLSVFLSANLFGQNVYIPDANFKAYLVGNPAINTNGDDEIQVSEASAFDGTIDCAYNGISDLTGIEAFTDFTDLDCQSNDLTSLNLTGCTALEWLDCQSNDLTTLDVSQNTALEHLNCGDCYYLTSPDLTGCTALKWLDCSWNFYLTTLDVSQNTALEHLNCRNNQLTTLDVSQNATLRYLNCSDNELASFDLTGCTVLEWLDCSRNHIISLDVSQNATLWYLECHDNWLTCLNAANGNNTAMTTFISDDNNNLTCIEVDDTEWSTTNWTSIGSQSSFSEDCNNDCSSSTVGINELSTSKNLIQILDLMGRETAFKPNTPLIYVYDDGSIEKVLTIE